MHVRQVDRRRSKPGGRAARSAFHYNERWGAGGGRKRRTEILQRRGLPHTQPRVHQRPVLLVDSAVRAEHHRRVVPEACGASLRARHLASWAEDLKPPPISEVSLLLRKRFPAPIALHGSPDERQSWICTPRVARQHTTSGTQQQRFGMQARRLNPAAASVGRAAASANWETASQTAAIRTSSARQQDVSQGQAEAIWTEKAHLTRRPPPQKKHKMRQALCVRQRECVIERLKLNDQAKIVCTSSQTARQLLHGGLAVELEVAADEPKTAKAVRDVIRFRGPSVSTA